MLLSGAAMASTDESIAQEFGPTFAAVVGFAASQSALLLSLAVVFVSVSVIALWRAEMPDSLYRVVVAWKWIGLLNFFGWLTINIITSGALV